MGSGLEIFHLWHHVGAQSVLGFVAFRIFYFQIWDLPQSKDKRKRMNFFFRIVAVSVPITMILGTEENSCVWSWVLIIRRWRCHRHHPREGHFQNNKGSRWVKKMTSFFLQAGANISLIRTSCVPNYFGSDSQALPTRWEQSGNKVTGMGTPFISDVDSCKCSERNRKRLCVGQGLVSVMSENQDLCAIFLLHETATTVAILGRKRLKTGSSWKNCKLQLRNEPQMNHTA
jgi:hypothetical protein